MAKGENIYKRKDGRWEGRYKRGMIKIRKLNTAIVTDILTGKQKKR